MSQAHRFAADAPHEFGGIALDRARPLQFRLNGRRIHGFAGDTVLTALLANGIDSYGRDSTSLLALTEQFCPLVIPAGERRHVDRALPMDRLPARDGAEFVSAGQRSRWPFVLAQGGRRSLAHALARIPEPAWPRAAPEATLAAELLVVGGGVAGLAAADAAAEAGQTVIVVERRPWLGGDARYFGAVGDEETPEGLTERLLERLQRQPGVTLLTHAEVFALRGTRALVHRIEADDGAARGAVVAIAASRVVLATGARQRLPVFAGNRLPGVVQSVAGYHLAKRYGVVHGRDAVVATQSNYAYRLALRLNDAGVAIRRIVDTRVNPQSRFVDFAKASGLMLGGGQVPVSVQPAPRHRLHIGFANRGSTAAQVFLDAGELIVGGSFQPDLSLWMIAGGGAGWDGHRLGAVGHVDHVALAGSAAGYRSIPACVASGRAAVASVFGRPAVEVAEAEIDAIFETPDAPTMLGPATPGAAAYFDAGGSRVVRAASVTEPVAPVASLALSLGDVATSVELGLIAPADAGAVAEERGAPGAELLASDWTPPSRAPEDEPVWLTGRFGPSPQRVHLVVDTRRRFERGALVYASSDPSEPLQAAGVVIAPPPEGAAGGIAIITRTIIARTDRFIVETAKGPSPARVVSQDNGQPPPETPS